MTQVPPLPSSQPAASEEGEFSLRKSAMVRLEGGTSFQGKCVRVGSGVLLVPPGQVSAEVIFQPLHSTAPYYID